MSTSEWIDRLSHAEGPMRWEAVDAIRHTLSPTESIPLLVSALDDEYWRARALAAHALSDLAQDASNHPELHQAVSPLAARVADECPAVRLNAVEALGLLGRGAASALRALKDVICYQDEDFRQAVAEAIGSIESHSSSTERSS